MSDPGTTYRNRDEIASMRTARDPIEFVKNLLVDNGLAEAQELKEIEKDIRKEVQVCVRMGGREREAEESEDDESCSGEGELLSFRV